MYLPSVVMVGFYFDKRRALATGLAVCGSGIGTFVLAPVVNLLVSEYGWRVSVAALLNFLAKTLNVPLCRITLTPCLDASHRYRCVSEKVYSFKSQ